jgi:8-oxo-dGTP pyrophosphatase MutT (NUDIX family)
MLRKENQVLLSLRKNTGYRDGMWGLIAGHVEEGESATCAMIREAAEEAGLCLKQSDLTFVHIIHRKEDRINIDIFFDCCHWEGTLSNLEPHRCEELRWFSLNALPEHTIGTIQRVFNAVSQNITYSEEGWD